METTFAQILHINEDLTRYEIYESVKKHGSTLKTLTFNGFYCVNITDNHIFLEKLSESVVTLKIISDRSTEGNMDLFDMCNKHPNIFSNVVNYFKNVRELILVGIDYYTPGLAEFCARSEHLEKIVFTVRHITIITEKKVHQNFINVIQHCKSLKTFEFFCDIPLEANIFNNIFSYLNVNFWEMEEIILDCEPLPSGIAYSNFYWAVTKMVLDFEITEDTSKLIIKPLEIQECVRHNYELTCQHDCLIEHKVFKSKSVTQFMYEPYIFRCQKYLETCFESFPFVQKVNINNYEMRSKAQTILNLMIRHLKCLKECYFRFNQSITSNYPPFSIVFEKFLKSFSNLTHLHLYLYKCISSDDSIKLISKHLKALTELSLVCKDSQISSVGLQLLTGNSFSNLEYLNVKSCKSAIDIKEWLKKMHEPENCSSNNFEIANQNTVSINVEKGNDERELNVLPVEILEHIFSFLHKNSQLQCRAVSKRWFDIFSSSLKLDRTLHFKDSYLSLNTSPVEILLSTEFKYNRMVFYKNTYFAKDGLSKFWTKIGKEIKEFILQDEALNPIGAYKTGLRENHLPNLEKLTISTYVLSIHYPIFFNILKKIKKMCLFSLAIKISTDSLKQFQNFELTNLKEFELYLIDDEIIFDMLSNCLSLNKLSIFFKKDKNFNTTFNFNQLTTLLIGGFNKWPTNFLKVICDNLSNLRSLGICMINERQIIANPIDLEFCDELTQKIFSKLKFLDEIFFISLSKLNARPIEVRHKLYRLNGFSKKVKESNERHHTFYEMCINFSNFVNVLYKRRLEVLSDKSDDSYNSSDSSNY